MNSNDSLPAPEPFEESSSTMGYWMLYVVLAGGVFLFVANTRFYGCRGSTRSTKLEWETRQAEISQSVAEAAASETAPPAMEAE